MRQGYHPEPLEVHIFRRGDTAIDRNPDLDRSNPSMVCPPEVRPKGTLHVHVAGTTCLGYRSMPRDGSRAACTRLP